eukprot:scaffold6011_cov137-Isochrysis_galbana.AAC.2
MAALLAVSIADPAPPKRRGRGAHVRHTQRSIRRVARKGVGFGVRVRRRRQASPPDCSSSPSAVPRPRREKGRIARRPSRCGVRRVGGLARARVFSHKNSQPQRTTCHKLTPDVAPRHHVSPLTSSLI